ncbi:MAG: hypothetical protein ABIM98_07535 [candidate division WOR-3 bacterium]
MLKNGKPIGYFIVQKLSKYFGKEAGGYIEPQERGKGYWLILSRYAFRYLKKKGIKFLFGLTPITPTKHDNFLKKIGIGKTVKTYLVLLIHIKDISAFIEKIMKIKPKTTCQKLTYKDIIHILTFTGLHTRKVYKFLYEILYSKISKNVKTIRSFLIIIKTRKSSTTNIFFSDFLLLKRYLEDNKEKLRKLRELHLYNFGPLLRIFNQFKNEKMYLFMIRL